MSSIMFESISYTYFELTLCAQTIRDQLNIFFMFTLQGPFQPTQASEEVWHLRLACYIHKLSFTRIKKMNTSTLNNKQLLKRT